MAKEFHGKHSRKEGKPRKPKKRLHSPAELANDPSLKWFPYHSWETVWSDTHGEELRFLEYVGDQVRLATLHGITPLGGSVPLLSIRRLTANKDNDAKPHTKISLANSPVKE